MLQVQAKAVQTRELRQAAWFERFAWFVSSENYLVLSARDAPQADLLVKRHMRCGCSKTNKRKKQLLLVFAAFSPLRMGRIWGICIVLSGCAAGRPAWLIATLRNQLPHYVINLLVDHYIT